MRGFSGTFIIIVIASKLQFLAGSLIVDLLLKLLTALGGL
jgi:hypothetical protein